MPEPGKVKEFTVGGKTLCVANIDGVICALGNECPHEGGRLSGGIVEEGKVVCPWHGRCFGPSRRGVRNFPKAGVEVYRITI